MVAGAASTLFDPDVADEVMDLIPVPLEKERLYGRCIGQARALYDKLKN
jgi:hypothetical protein